MTLQSAPIPAARVEAELARVFARYDFHPEPSLTERFLHWLATKLGLRGLEAFDQLVQVLLVVLAVSAALFLARRIANLYRARRFVPSTSDASPALDLAARIAALAHAARAARAAGDLRLALRLLFQALLLALGGRGDLEFRAAWTNRELLRRGKPSRAARTLLEPLVRELEPMEFGRAHVTAADVERLEHLLAPHLERESGEAA